MFDIQLQDTARPPADSFSQAIPIINDAQIELKDAVAICSETERQVTCLCIQRWQGHIL